MWKAIKQVREMDSRKYVADTGNPWFRHSKIPASALMASCSGIGREV